MRREVVAVGLIVALAACGGTPSPDLNGPTEPSAEPGGEATSDSTASGGETAPAAQQPAPDGEDAPAAPVASGGGAEADAILAAHNQVRAKHCARPLSWSPALAATAQEWANALRDSGCRFEHSQTAYGENLAAGTRLTGTNAVELWYAESGKYNFKKPGFSPATGHFTQVVWAGSRNLGCGFSECQGMRLWVCHYDPPGNVLSLFPDNVVPATCK